MERDSCLQGAIHLILKWEGEELMTPWKSLPLMNYSNK